MFYHINSTLPPRFSACHRFTFGLIVHKHVRMSRRGGVVYRHACVLSRVCAHMALSVCVVAFYVHPHTLGAAEVPRGGNVPLVRVVDCSCLSTWALLTHAAWSNKTEIICANVTH